MPADLSSLRDRIAAARGPSFVLEQDIENAFPLVPGEHRVPPAYTASIEAAVALVERTAPHLSWKVQRSAMPNKLWADAVIWDWRDITLPHWRFSGETTPAIAICAALLSALAAKETERG